MGNRPFIMNIKFALAIIAVVLVVVGYFTLGPKPGGNQLLAGTPDFGAIGGTQNFLVYYGNDAVPKREVDTTGLAFPLDEQSACLVAEKACGANACNEVKNIQELIEKLGPESQSFSEFDWAVSLPPICGPAMALISEKGKKVICSCAYE